MSLVLGDLALVTVDPRLALLAAGYLVLLPGLVALVVGWGTLAQVIFSGAYLSAVAIAVPLAWTSIEPFSRLVLLMAVLVGVGASVAGNGLVRRHRIEAYVLRQRLQATRLRAERQHLELSRLYETLGSMARTDPLTGTGNRRRLDEDLATLHGRLARYGQEIGLVVIDIDHFKAANDTYGHLVGDDVLRQVAHALSATCRSGDAVYRYGEEFLVVVAGQSLKGAATAAERFRAAVEALGIPNPGNRPSGHVTISAGVTTIGPAEGTRDPAAWLRRADQALYAAKATGRNRVNARPAPRAKADVGPAMAPALVDVAGA